MFMPAVVLEKPLRMGELGNMRLSAEDLVKTYLGERTGKQVLAGRTKRGEGEKIHAVIWLCDLRDLPGFLIHFPLRVSFAL